VPPLRRATENQFLKTISSLSCFLREVLLPTLGFLWKLDYTQQVVSSNVKKAKVIKHISMGLPNLASLIE